MYSTLPPAQPRKSALKVTSRSSSPTNELVSPNLSPQITRVMLPSASESLNGSPVLPTTSLPTAGTISRTHSSSSIPSSSLHHPPLHHYPLSSPQSAFHIPGHVHGQPAVPLNPAYRPKVSFDTFENPVASMFSFTLQVKTAGYRRSRNTRVFLCASSPDESGSEALDWSLESLVQDGDELIVFRGVDEDVFEKDHDSVRDEARDLMRSIQEKAVEYDPDRKLSLVLEYIPGKITDSIDRLIALYRPDSLVVGTRGRRFGVGLMQDLGAGLAHGLGVGSGSSIGSVSKYCLSHSPVPVIVVRPGRKLKKGLEKRRADPKRGRHFE